MQMAPRWDAFAALGATDGFSRARAELNLRAQFDMLGEWDRQAKAQESRAVLRRLLEHAGIAVKDLPARCGLRPVTRPDGVL